MKLSKEELKEKINMMEIDDEKKIELLEDIEDSIDKVEDTTEIEELKKKYDELVEKYKARFLGKKDDEEKEDEEKETEEVKEEEVIDVKEI